MDQHALPELAEQQLTQARNASNGRSTTALYGGRGRVLGQVLIALTAGAQLAEHDNPGEATAHVLHGRARLVAGDSTQEGATGDLLIVPQERHSLDAVEDTVVLLTIAKHTSQ